MTARDISSSSIGEYSGMSAARRPVPSLCMARLACARLGCCGRDQCIADDERERFADELAQARSGANPHRPPDVAEFYGKETRRVS